MVDLEVASFNIIASYLAKQDVTNTVQLRDSDAVILCGSELLYQAERLFEVLQAQPDVTPVVVLCGGIGHSTQYLRAAVSRHARFQSIADEAQTLAEARILELILHRFYDVALIKSKGCKILVEDQSTNCGANALFAKKTLDEHGVLSPRKLVFIQDPTMAMRTYASFLKAYEGSRESTVILSCPFFVPQVDKDFRYKVSGVPDSSLWHKTSRFSGLVMAEIPKIEDTETGYGPRGTGFIVHMDVPDKVSEAWGKLFGPPSTT